MLDDLRELDLVRDRDDALGQAEADGEVLEVGGARHHHGVGAAVVDQRDRHLLRHTRRAPAPIPPPRQTPRSTLRTGAGIGYSAASHVGAMRRDCRACSS